MKVSEIGLKHVFFTHSAIIKMGLHIFNIMSFKKNWGDLCPAEQQ